MSVHDGKDIDGNADTADDDTITVTVTVADVDEAPTIKEGPENVDYAENRGDAVASYTADDPENEDLDWRLEGPDRDLFEIGSSGVLAFKLPPDHEMPEDFGGNNVYDVTVEANDPDGNKGSRDVTVRVTNVNEAPTVTGQMTIQYQENRDDAVAPRYRADDPENQDVDWTVAGPDRGLFEISSSGVLAFKLPPDHETRLDSGGNNVYDVIVRATERDSQSPLTGTRTVAVTVTNVDEPPTIDGPANVDYAENRGDAVASYTADDPENQDVDWTPRGLDAGLFQISSSGELAFKSPPDREMPKDSGENNVYDVIVRATERNSRPALWGTHPVTVTVTNVDEPPTIDGLANVDYAEGGTGNVATYRAVDPEGATIIWTLAGAQGGKFTITNGVLKFRETPDFEERPSYALIVEASDGNPRNVASIDVTITVSNANEPPVVSGITEIERFEDNATGTLANYTADDPDGNDVIWGVIGVDSNDFVIDASGALSFKDPVDYDDPSDSNRDNIFNVEVTATDDGRPQPLRGELPVKVTLLDVNEDAGVPVHRERHAQRARKHPRRTALRRPRRGRRRRQRHPDLLHHQRRRPLRHQPRDGPVADESRTRPRDSPQPHHQGWRQ